MKKSLIPLLSVVLILCMLQVGCGGGSKNIKTETGNIQYSENVKKSVPIPDEYPKNQFPIYKEKDSFISVLQQEGKSFIVICFAKDNFNDVIKFYEDALKNGQVISTSRDKAGFVTMGMLGGYTYTVAVEESKEMEGYPTTFVINILPAAGGMPESLKGMPSIIGSGSLQADASEPYLTGEGVKMPAGYPEKVLPIFGGSLTSVEAVMENQGRIMVGFMSKKEYSEVVDYYKGIMQGSKNFSATKNGQTTSISGVKEGYKIMIMVRPNEAGTKVDKAYITLVQLEYTREN